MADFVIPQQGSLTTGQVALLPPPRFGQGPGVAGPGVAFPPPVFTPNFAVTAPAAQTTPRPSNSPSPIGEVGTPSPQESGEGEATTPSPPPSPEQPGYGVGAAGRKYKRLQARADDLRQRPEQAPAFRRLRSNVTGGDIIVPQSGAEAFSNVAREGLQAFRRYGAAKDAREAEAELARLEAAQEAADAAREDRRVAAAEAEARAAEKRAGAERFAHSAKVELIANEKFGGDKGAALDYIRGLEVRQAAIKLAQDDTGWLSATDDQKAAMVQNYAQMLSNQQGGGGMNRQVTPPPEYAGWSREQKQAWINQQAGI